MVQKAFWDDSRKMKKSQNGMKFGLDLEMKAIIGLVLPAGRYIRSQGIFQATANTTS